MEREEEGLEGEDPGDSAEVDRRAEEEEGEEVFPLAQGRGLGREVLLGGRGKGVELDSADFAWALRRRMHCLRFLELFEILWVKAGEIGGGLLEGGDV